MGRGRSEAPAPLVFESSGSRRQDSWGSNVSDKDKVTTTQSSTSPSFDHDHHQGGHAGEQSKNHDHHHHHHSPTVNVYTHCGRHTDQYLFGGKSISDLWRSAFRKD
ncbi:hypothetical protein GGR56DRAFT_672161 [Xylariaceae sp. FL0804]|nr:hypothetical protein GGR56DRAFT_672161 [Xylariaceae sp. FL0804]